MQPSRCGRPGDPVTFDSVSCPLDLRRRRSRPTTSGRPIALSPSVRLGFRNGLQAVRDMVRVGLSLSPNAATMGRALPPVKFMRTPPGPGLGVGTGRTHARTHTCARKRTHAHAHSMHKSTYMRALSLAHALATVHVHKYTCVRRSLKCTNAAPFTLSWFESPPTSFVRGGGEFAGAPCERRHSPFTPTPAPSLPPSLPLPLSPSSRPYSSQELKDNRGGSPSARPHSRHTRCAPTRANTRVRNLCSRELSVASISLNLG